MREVPNPVSTASPMAIPAMRATVTPALAMPNAVRPSASTAAGAARRHGQPEAQAEEAPGPRAGRSGRSWGRRHAEDHEARPWTARARPG